ncbi:hypothetical protein [Alcaligenes parafaecalis]|uniref:Uncharacterized protein n=1 Tax=Alcaligenes parafaecalis TaxID=171260 RepID=A0ABT3VII3_9BURK|nr:hypothetical protein [Alcaligenes parafaecalis]MCX5463307.1 hypothetical protein [Alcaligenes parafaecalis]
MTVKAKVTSVAIQPGLSCVFLGYKSSGITAKDKSHRELIKSYPEGNKDDWAGFYVAEDRTTAEGYLPDSLPKNGTGDAYINLIYIEASTVNNFDGKGKKTQFVDITGSEIADPGVPQKEKARLVKKALSDIGIQIPESKPLIETLGLQGYIYRGPHTATELEVIIPFNFINAKLAISLANLQSFKFKGHLQVGSPVLNPALGITSPDTPMQTKPALSLAL